MGALPKRRISSARRGKRRAAIRLKLPTLVSCPECGQPKKPHQVCPKCRNYKGKQVVAPQEEKTEKSNQK